MHSVLYKQHAFDRRWRRLSCYTLYKYDNGLLYTKTVNVLRMLDTGDACLLFHIKIPVVSSVSTSDRYKSLVCTVCVGF